MPFMGYKTYYRVVGEASEKAPLLLLHGGPGSTHNYFEVLDCIADTGRQVISYDQIGCGNSYLDGHPELWTQKTWIDELIAIPVFGGVNGEDDGTTGIEVPLGQRPLATEGTQESSIFNVQSKDVYYNLQGQRVDNPTKGLYIRNGKKVVIK